MKAGSRGNVKQRELCQGRADELMTIAAMPYLQQSSDHAKRSLTLPLSELDGRMEERWHAKSASSTNETEIRVSMCSVCSCDERSAAHAESTTDCPPALSKRSGLEVISKGLAHRL